MTFVKKKSSFRDKFTKKKHFATPNLYPEQSTVNDAGFFSKWFFFYLNPIFAHGKKVPLEEKDVPYPASRNISHNVVERLESAWKTERKKKNPSLLHALFKCNMAVLPKKQLNK